MDNTKKCKYDYGFEPADYNERIWKGIDCSDPFKIMGPNEKKWTGCYPTFNPKDLGGFNDESKKKDEASLKCAFTKWNWKGDKRTTILEPIKLKRRRTRRAKMKKIMKKVCNRYNDYCPKDEDEEKHSYCDESKACDDGSPNLLKELKLSVKIIMDAFKTVKTPKDKSKSKKKKKPKQLKTQGFQRQYGTPYGSPYSQAGINQRHLTYGRRMAGGQRCLSKKLLKKNKIKNSRKKKRN